MFQRAAVGGAVLAATLGGTLIAAGPAHAAQSTQQLKCGNDVLTVRTNNDNSSQNGGWDAAHVIGDGHLIPTSFSGVANDIEPGFSGTNPVLTFTSVKGGTNANHNQQQVTCTTSFTDTFADFAPGYSPPPAGVNPSDTILVTITVTAVPKV